MAPKNLTLIDTLLEPVTDDSEVTPHARAPLDDTAKADGDRYVHPPDKNPNTTHRYHNTGKPLRGVTPNGNHHHTNDTNETAKANPIMPESKLTVLNGKVPTVDNDENPTHHLNEPSEPHKPLLDDESLTKTVDNVSPPLA